MNGTVLTEQPLDRGPVSYALSLAERGLLPDALIRAGIRRLLRNRLRDLHESDCEQQLEVLHNFVVLMEHSAIAPLPDKANAQHYEVPAVFFQHVLGDHLKYSCAYWGSPGQLLPQAEAEALRITCERAGLEDGMSILELGCGWGSLTLWMAQHYPKSRITAVSNSMPQREFIEKRLLERGLSNVDVQTADMNQFDASERFDRIVSVEMFEHMRNYPRLFRRIAGWLSPQGRFFMHIFCHRNVPYEFIPKDASDWMSRYFFSGGMMPSDALPLYVNDALHCVQQWRWNGQHYQKTADAWLARMDAKRDVLWPILEQTYGADQAARWWQRWRIFFMACAELFAYRQGQEWWVSHYLFKPAQAHG